jgi:lactate dehydrogenase-like 2-hydroxyacid dehydrogenase
MISTNGLVKIATLDDYQHVALKMADWTPLHGRATITVFNDHLADPDRVVERLLPFDVVCVMRERSPLPRSIIERLPRLKLIASTAFANASIDIAAAGEREIAVVHTGYDSSPTVELTWALILASVRHIIAENLSLRSGGWQLAIGDGLRGKTLGILGLGNIGSEIARVGLAFGMEVIAWSENLTPERAQSSDARLGRCGRACGHEALGAAREHVAWTDRPGGGAHRGTRSTQNCRRRHRRIRRRTITIGPSVSLIGECSRHPVYRLRLPRTL